MPALDVDGVRLRYEDAGGGEPVVLLHGFTSSYAENWVETGWVARLVGEGFRVVGLDVRGHGASAKLYSAADYETPVLASDVAAVLDRLAIGQAHAVGFSMGAGITLQLALDRPERVGAVVVAGIGDKAIRGLHDEGEIREIVAVLSGTDEDASAVAHRIRRNAARPGNDAAALAAYFDRGGWPGDLASVREVTTPTLVVVAEDDEFMPTANELVRRLGADAATLDGCAHAAAVRDPRFVELTVSFLRDHPLTPL